MVSDDGDAAEDEGRMPPYTRTAEYSGKRIYSNKITYHLEQLRHRFTGGSTDVEPVPEALHTPFNCLCCLSRLETGVVDTEEFDGLRVPPLALVYGHNMKDAVVADAMHGHAYPDSHGGAESQRKGGGCGRSRVERNERTDTQSSHA